MLQYVPILPALGIALFFIAAMVIHSGPLFWFMVVTSTLLLGAGLALGSYAMLHGLAMSGIMTLVLSVAGLIILSHPFVSRR